MGRTSDPEEQVTAPPAPAGRTNRLRLVVIGEGLAVTHPLPATGRVVVGRSSKSDVRIDDPSVSREHLAIHVGESIEVEDLGSSNGTRVQDEPIVARERIAVSPGDVVEAGSFLLVVQRAAEPLAQTPRVDPGPVDRPAGDIVVAGGLRDLLRLVERIARSPISVLLLGETGVGKEVIAERLHATSPRGKGPFLRLNCAALTEALLESELFGHEKGAFTGAVRTKLGLLETAEGGTVFLDEVGELPPSTQVKLLRVLEDRKVTRVGGISSRAIDVRFVAATNRDLDAEVARGTFRSDLFYRLNGISLVVPPLRERVAEIEPLARTFLAAAAARLGRPVPEISDEALSWLLAHPWPGNIRELRNVVERAAVLCEGRRIERAHLPSPEAATASRESAAPAPQPGRDRLLKDELGEMEKRRILDALEACAGNQTRAAKRLGISRKTLVARLDEYRVPRPRKRPD